MGKQRHRQGRYGTYTPKKTVDYELLIRQCYLEQSKVKYLGLKENEALAIEINAYYGVPKSATKAKRAKMLSNEWRPKKKPDFDNISKMVGDALNGVAYHDDAEIVSGRIEKWYSDNPRVEVKIYLVD